MSSIARSVLYSLQIRRVEFRIAELPLLIIPVMLCMESSAVLKTLAFWKGVLIFFFLFAFGDMINCLADRDLDAVYKQKLSRAVYGLGTGSVKIQIAVSALCVLALGIHVAWQLDRWSILLLLLVGLMLGAAYSVPPIRLKSRGLWALLCLWIIIFVGPMLLAAMLVKPLPSVAMLALAMAYGTLQMGVTLVNTAEDYPEDLEAGLKTSIIALGLKRGLRLAWWLGVLGALSTLLALGFIAVTRVDGPNAYLLLLPALFGTGFVCFELTKLKNALVGLSLEASIEQVKTTAKRVPLWFTLNAWSICLSAAGILAFQKSL